MQAAFGTLDGIIDTVSAAHALMPLVNLLRSHGKLIMVGAPERPLELPVFPLLVGKHMIFFSCSFVLFGLMVFRELCLTCKFEYQGGK